ncbi:hypothetical protein F5884DRAFT_671125 [Xylogone sp. PMI_703]|nr:hypothetical protein F5884DRAFT_671125 [Xylogone sp. PMI_703]
MTRTQVFEFGKETLDPTHRFETSWLLSPWALSACRALFATYALTTSLFILGWESGRPDYGGPYEARLSFSYFTGLCYWGLATYFLVASIHTFSYALYGSPLLDRFPRPLQALHHFFYTTITTYPFLVTIVYWGVLYSGTWFPTRFPGWSNISQHALNSVFAVFEIVIPRTEPPPWIHLLWLIVILVLYLALAYVTYATKGVYVYDFLDPGHGHRGRTVGYIFSIAVGICVIFAIVKGTFWWRIKVTERGKRKVGSEIREIQLEEIQEVWKQ